MDTTSTENVTTFLVSSVHRISVSLLRAGSPGRGPKAKFSYHITIPCHGADFLENLGIYAIYGRKYPSHQLLAKT